MATNTPEHFPSLEPGGYGEHLVKTVTEATQGLAALLESTLFSAQLAANLYERLEEVDKKLDETNELLRNMIQVLGSRS